ncbi:hypothetical protein [Pseudomonas sp. EA_65y_Pfl2_P74]|uniref:hypothetical protein n=1 Tax=Pseudomonas sp. EA_65y_Pfl2_P74 TaxID=3088694 RepID=UPI0030D9B4F7
MEPLERGPAALKGSTIDVVHGKRRVTVYTLAEDTLENLGTLQLTASLCFAIALALLSFSAGAFMSISLAGTAAPVSAVATWNTLKWTTMAFGSFFLVVSFLSQFRHSQKWNKIKTETIHDDQIDGQAAG